MWTVLTVLRILRLLATLGRCVARAVVRPTSGRFRIIPILMVVSVLVLSATVHARQVTAFQAEGDCYTLVARYLKERNLAYIVSDELRSRNCSWNFQGDTQADFTAWCKSQGLKCGGNPYYVGYDSVWYNGDFVPHQRAIYLKKLEQDQKRERFVLDSISSHRDTLENKSVTIEYLEIGKSTAERIGFNYSEYIGSAKFFDYTDLFSVTIQARNSGDTTFIYRTYTTLYDSTLHVFWGGSRDKIKQSNVTANGVVSNNYVTESYGLTFDIDNLKYSYTHSTDYEHSISGNGKLVYGRNAIFGTYSRTYQLEQGLPWLSSVPLVGALFRHVTDEHETRYVFIYVTIGGAQ